MKRFLIKAATTGRNELFELGLLTLRWSFSRGRAVAITAALVGWLTSAQGTIAAEVPVAAILDVEPVSRLDARKWWQSECAGSSACPAPPHPEFAILDFRDGPAVLAIDGVPTADSARQSRWAALPPGPHMIAYGGVFAYSQAYSLPSVRRELHQGEESIDFEPGHVYVTRRERSYYHERTDYLWIENTSTSEIVAGAPPGDRKELFRRSNAAREARIERLEFEKLYRVARCGDVAAQEKIALYYLAGLSPVGRRDVVAAYAWYSRAAAHSGVLPEAVKDRIAAELAPEQLRQAALVRAELDLAHCPDAGAPKNSGGRKKARAVP